METIKFSGGVQCPNTLYHLIYLYTAHTLTLPAVLSVAAGIMALHYEEMVKTFDACPLPLLAGESETGQYIYS